MPLKLTPIDVDPLCSGFTWQVLDLDQLAELVAEILVARHEHVLRIVEGARSKTPLAKRSVVESVLARKLETPRTDQARYHRDGLLFQHIAWIAAAHVRQDGDFFSIPHSRPADKGQDMVVVHTAGNDDDGEKLSVTICEDKATRNSRDMFRNRVLPEIEEYESGARDDELESETLSILERHHDKDRAQELIQEIFWDRARRYRVTMTVTGSHDSSAGRHKLFSGYDGAAQGDKRRRRGETMRIDDLRSWFEAFASRVRSALLTMVDGSDV